MFCNWSQRQCDLLHVFKKVKADAGKVTEKKVTGMWCRKNGLRNFTDEKTTRRLMVEIIECLPSTKQSKQLKTNTNAGRQVATLFIFLSFLSAEPSEPKEDLRVLPHTDIRRCSPCVTYATQNNLCTTEWVSSAAGGIGSVVNRGKANEFPRSLLKAAVIIESSL